MQGLHRPQSSFRRQPMHFPHRPLGLVAVGEVQYLNYVTGHCPEHTKITVVYSLHYTLCNVMSSIYILAALT